MRIFKPISRFFVYAPASAIRGFFVFLVIASLTGLMPGLMPGLMTALMPDLNTGLRPARACADGMEGAFLVGRGPELDLKSELPALPDNGGFQPTEDKSPPFAAFITRHPDGESEVGCRRVTALPPDHPAGEMTAALATEGSGKYSRSLLLPLSWNAVSELWESACLPDEAAMDQRWMVWYTDATDGTLSDPVFTKPGERVADKADSLEMSAADIIATSDGSFNAVLGVADAGDWYQFYGLSGEVYDISAFGAPSFTAGDGTETDPATATLTVEILDAAGTVITGFESAPPDYAPLEWECPADGLYFVRVGRLENPATSPDGAGGSDDDGTGDPDAPDPLDYTFEINRSDAAQVGDGFSGFISGLVMDAATGAPLSGVMVFSSMGGADTTRSNGAFLLLHDPGEFSLTAALEGYREIVRNRLILNEGGSLHLEFCLSALTGPAAVIRLPSHDPVIEVGESVIFEGAALGGSPPLTPSWNFGSSGLPVLFQEDPGELVFSVSGEFQVQFTVIDAPGRSSTDRRVVFVQEQSSDGGGGGGGCFLDALLKSVSAP